MPFWPPRRSVVDLVRALHSWRISRRALLRLGMIGLAAKLSPTSASAQSRPTPEVGHFNPYRSQSNRGPTSIDVAAIGSTPAVPGTPYLVSTSPKWSCTSLLTAGNEVDGYTMCGEPDGLGAFDNGDGTITLLINHEIEAGHSVVRGHGFTGAFVSRWIVRKDTLEVVKGRDFVEAPQNLQLHFDGQWYPANQLTGVELDLSRLCSADLAPRSAFWNEATGKGYAGRIYLNGEEHDHRRNRGFAWVVEEDAAYQLPIFTFGMPGDPVDVPADWENLLANPATGDTTLVIANSDGGPSRIFVYIGQKQATGRSIDKAGLTNGALFSIKVNGVERENRLTNIGIKKSLRGKGAGKRVSLVSHVEGTAFLRPEDGAWDPSNPNVYYFATTDRNNYAADGSVAPGKDAKQIARSRLWAVTFDDVRAIATDGRSVGKIELLLDGTEGGDMFDNITVDRNGVVYLCEDTGDSRHNGKIWAYNTKSGQFSQIMRLNPAMFGDIEGRKYKPPVKPFTDDKETSGILDVTDLFADASWFRAGSTVLLVTVEAHFDFDSSAPLGDRIYEGGQILVLVKAP